MSLPIPQPPGIPLLGNIFDINPNNTWGSLKKLAEKYGEIFQIKVLGHTIVFVAGAALAEELCNEKRFRKYVGGPVVEIRYAVHDALFTAYDHETSWGVAHRIIAPQLAPAAVAEQFDEMRDLATELIENWRGQEQQQQGGRQFSLAGELNRLALETLTLNLYGKRLNGLTGPEHPMLQAMEDSTSEAMKRPTRPSFLNWLVYGGKLKSATGTMRAYAADMVANRKAHPTDRQDFLATLLNASDPETGRSLTDSQVIDEIVTMPIGSSTAPLLVSAAVYFLLRNPAVLAEARAEIDSVVGAGPLLRDHLPRLKYLEGVMREALRLSFPAPGFNLEPIPRGDEAGGDKSPILLGGGKYQVAHNQPMIVVLAGVNRDPAVFEDPLAFRPERMLGEAFDRLPAGAKKWYGNGKRECVGKHWAWQWDMTLLAKLVREVDFEMADPGYELQQDGWFNLRPVGFNVRVKMRAA